ncbi:hypothetical protein GPJ56_000958 [Histomonas meleagridis]|uniref:uncharacterized protein n=1 Tax=Histomonas meleagridis TaxID=135588 RepID=UPI00355A9D76|nr:hypothetical protein GPJ56_000958 [Histomonas meleagridis]KAH0803793.1 hypothetical protein GO595_002623 [Histomonas meleagridis]
MFSCHGILRSKSNEFGRKVTYYALSNFIEYAGDFKFDSVIREDDEAYVYRFVNNNQSAYFAWAPISDIEQTNTVNFTHRSGDNPLYAYVLGKEKIESVQLEVSDGTVTLEIDGYPRLIVGEKIDINTESNGLTGGQIAGIVIGVIAGVALITVGAIFGYRYYKKRKVMDDAPDDMRPDL